MSGNLHVKDDRTSLQYTIKVENNVVRGSDLGNIRGPRNVGNPHHPPDERLRIFDSGYENTAIMSSSVTFADGRLGALEFRGQKMEDLARNFTYEEVGYLLIWDRMPSAKEKCNFRRELALASRNIPKSVVNVIRSLPTSTPYISMIMCALSAWVGCEATAIPAMMGHTLYHGNELRVDRAIVTTLAAYAVVVSLVYCHRSGRPHTPADPNNSYLANLVLMMGLRRASGEKLSAEDLRFIEEIWIIGADHELTNSTSALLHTASSLADPISCVISAIASSYGPLHFGAAESCYRLMQQIAEPCRVRQALVEHKRGKQRIMGIGHRVYKARDPRCEPVKDILRRLKEKGNEDALVAVAEEIERQVALDTYFSERQLCINVDLYWLFIYTSLDIPVDVILPMFLASRMSGFMAHWREAMTQPIKLWRPNQVYTGQRAKRQPNMTLKAKI